MTTNSVLEHEIAAAMHEDVDGIAVLPDIDGLTRRLDRGTRAAPVRRMAIGVVAAFAAMGGVALAAGGGGDERPQSVASTPTAHKPAYIPDFSDPPKADWDEYEPPPTTTTTPTTTAPVTVKQTESPTTAPKPKPAPTTAAPKPDPTTTVKPAPSGDTVPPPITITSPANGSSFDTKQVTFTGETEPGAKVYVDGIWVEPDAAGHWRVTLTLAPGTNVKKFKAMDDAGNRTYAEVTVHCTAESKAFTANQTYGSSAENPPFDVFYGTAEPGALVKVASSYGWAEGYADANGAYELRVTFADAPVGKTFDVKVRSGDAYKYFTFTRTA